MGFILGGVIVVVVVVYLIILYLTIRLTNFAWGSFRGHSIELNIFTKSDFCGSLGIRLFTGGSEGRGKIIYIWISPNPTKAGPTWKELLLLLSFFFGHQLIKNKALLLLQNLFFNDEFKSKILLIKYKYRTVWTN